MIRTEAQLTNVSC